MVVNAWSWFFKDASGLEIACAHKIDEQVL